MFLFAVFYQLSTSIHRRRKGSWEILTGKSAHGFFCEGGGSFFFICQLHILAILLEYLSIFFRSIAFKLDSDTKNPHCYSTGLLGAKMSVPYLTRSVTVHKILIVSGNWEKMLEWSALVCNKPVVR